MMYAHCPAVNVLKFVPLPFEIDCDNVIVPAVPA